MSQDGQRDPKGRLKGAQGHSKGNHRSPKDAPRAPKRVKRSQKSVQGAPKVLQRHPEEAKGSQRERYISKNSRSTAQADVMLCNIYIYIYIYTCVCCVCPRIISPSKEQSSIICQVNLFLRRGEPWLTVIPIQCSEG